VGVAGLLGSGKGSLARAVFDTSWEDGTVTVNGKTLAKGSGPQPSISAGLAYVPADRHASGLILDFAVDWNVSLPNVSLKQTPLLDLQAEREDADTYMRQLSIKAPSRSTIARALSGGNQQKVVLAKWLACEAQIFIMDSPTLGVDVGAKEELYRLFRELVARGRSVLLVSDDLLELIGLSNRIVVMRDGRIADTLAAPTENKPGEEELIQIMAAGRHRVTGEESLARSRD
jgi:ribose transport system ATP-binding protein